MHGNVFLRLLRLAQCYYIQCLVFESTGGSAQSCKTVSLLVWSSITISCTLFIKKAPPSGGVGLLSLLGFLDISLLAGHVGNMCGATGSGLSWGENGQVQIRIHMYEQGYIDHKGRRVSGHWNWNAGIGIILALGRINVNWMIQYYVLNSNVQGIGTKMLELKLFRNIALWQEM